MTPSPEHLSLLAAIVSQLGTRTEDAVKKALALFDMAHLQLAIRRGKRDPKLTCQRVLMTEVFPPGKQIRGLRSWPSRYPPQ